MQNIKTRLSRNSSQMRAMFLLAFLFGGFSSMQSYAASYTIGVMPFQHSIFDDPSDLPHHYTEYHNQHGYWAKQGSYSWYFVADKPTTTDKKSPSEKAGQETTIYKNQHGYWAQTGTYSWNFVNEAPQVADTKSSTVKNKEVVVKTASASPNKLAVAPVPQSSRVMVQ